MNKTTMDTLSDQLQSKVFQNLVDLADFQNCRLVSQKWKRTVMKACHNKFHVVYPLTDSTLYTANELQEAPVSFDIYAFTGNENKDAWQTSGIEPLMQITESLQFSGSEISSEEIRKILGLAHVSLKTLAFKCLQKDLVWPFLTMQETFGAVLKLSIGYYSVERDNDTFNTFTNTLEKWNSLGCRVQLPLLERLNLYFHCRGNYNGNNIPPIEVTNEDLIRNYIAIGKLLLKYKQTLKEVQVERIANCYMCVFNPHLVDPKWSEMERGLETLDELNLNRLKLSTISNNGYILETEVLGRPKNLKSVLYNNLICPGNDRWIPLIAALSSFRNLDAIYLTSIKISLTLCRSPDPTMAVNLGGLTQCRNLRTLWLNINSMSGPAQLFVKNVELLPKGISNLRFESTKERRYTFGEELLLNQQQIRWIIDNLQELESFCTSLLIPEQTNANDTREADNAAQQEHVNRLVNINLDTFRDLIAMPKLKKLKVDLMKARTLSFSARALLWEIVHRPILPTTLGVIREYSDLCKAAGYATTTITESIYSNNNFSFATLIIQRNQS